MNTWKMWAHDDDGIFLNSGDKWWVTIHGIDLPIVPIILTESETGKYWGWIEKDSPVPEMIWPSKGQVDMCFPYGVKAEEERGRGRLVQLDIQKDDSNRPDDGPQMNKNGSFSKKKG